jgi:hypothetical protein
MILRLDDYGMEKTYAEKGRHPYDYPRKIHLHKLLTILSLFSNALQRYIFSQNNWPFDKDILSLHPHRRGGGSAYLPMQQHFDIVDN